MFSISFGLIPASTFAVGVARERSPDFTGTPSITYTGAAEPDIAPTPRIPYLAVDAAYFSAVMFSISFGLIPASTFAVGVARERSPEVTGTPSIPYNGAEEPDIDPTPRIRMVCIDPGCPDPPVDCSPG